MRQIAVLVLGVALLPAQNTAIVYDTVPQSEIERRVGDFKHTNPEREQELKLLFEEAGCKNVVEQAVKHSRNPNVICTLPGQTEQPIIVGGHFDFVDSGQGVVDNWSGCSLLPSLYLSLKSSNRRHTFVFVGFTDEEKGMVGSAFFVDHMSKEELRGISAMVNLDSLGASPTKVEIDRGNKALINALGLVASSMHLPVNAVNVHTVGRSDSDSFQDRRIPTIMIHSITNETWPILHSRNDTMAAMRLPDYYDSYRLLAAYLAYLDVSLDAPAADK
jgi:Zn-dependent M28 family amino/carboxypeptidase